MKILTELTDKSVHNMDIPSDFTYRVRRSARAIIFDNEKIALIKATTGDYHKLPGGGIEDGETVEEALKREVLEEIGCTIEVGQEVGISVEQRSEHELAQISYCYTATLLQQTNVELVHNEYEEKWGFQLIWVTLNEAVKLLQQDNPDNYLGKFVVQRDLAFLHEARGRPAADTLIANCKKQEIEFRLIGSAAVIKEKKILLTKRSKNVSYPGMWSFPGGKISSARDDFATVACREVKEEVGLDFTVTKQFGFYEWFTDDLHAVVHVHLGTFAGNLEIDTYEVQQADWFSFEEAMKKDLAFNYKQALQDLNEQNLIE